MADSIKFPGWRWDPYTGEGRVFQIAADVPEGWIDQHPANLPTPAPKAPVKAADELTGAEVKAALDLGRVTYQKNAGAAALLKTLKDSLSVSLTAKGVKVAPDATAKAMLLELTGAAK